MVPTKGQRDQVVPPFDAWSGSDHAGLDGDRRSPRHRCCCLVVAGNLNASRAHHFGSPEIGDAMPVQEVTH